MEKSSWLSREGTWHKEEGGTAALAILGTDIWEDTVKEGHRKPEQCKEEECPYAVGLDVTGL